MAYSYKTVPAPMVLGIGKGKSPEEAIAKFSVLINNECHDGWEFYSMETITISEPPGCMSLSKQPITSSYNMLVFRKGS